MLKLIISIFLFLAWSMLVYEGASPDKWAMVISGAILLAGWIANAD